MLFALVIYFADTTTFTTGPLFSGEECVRIAERAPQWYRANFTYPDPAKNEIVKVSCEMKKGRP